MNDSNIGLGTVVTRRQMLKGALTGLAAAGLLMTAPRRAWAAGPKRNVANGIYEILSWRDNSYRLVTWSGGTGYESRKTLDIGTYNGSDLVADRYWALVQHPRSAFRAATEPCEERQDNQLGKSSRAPMSGAFIALGCKDLLGAD